jgi:hypothetical protein
MADRVRGEVAIELATPHPLAPQKRGSRPLPPGEVMSAPATKIENYARTARLRVR